MKPPSIARTTLLALMLPGAFVAGQLCTRTVAAQSRQKWEYQIVGCSVGCTGQVNSLNKLGEDGWEVVALNASNRPLLRRAK